MTLTGFVCLLSWALGIGGAAERHASVEALLRDAPIAPRLVLPAPPMPSPTIAAPAIVSPVIAPSTSGDLLRDAPVAPPLALPAVSSKLSARAEAEAQRLGPNIWLQTELRAPLRDAVEQSRTFRRLVERIGRAQKVHVAVTLDPAVARAGLSRAECELRSYDSGLLFAQVRLPNILDAAELAAHELEHVAEWLDGVNLRREFLLRGRGVWQLPDGRFESQRAIATSERVLDELASARRLTRREPRKLDELAASRRGRP